MASMVTLGYVLWGCVQRKGWREIEDRYLRLQNCGCGRLLEVAGSWTELQDKNGENGRQCCFKKRALQWLS